MTEAKTPSPRTYDFFIRRVHSLLGLVPIGVFLVMHLVTNALIVASEPGADLYQKQVNNIHALGPFLVPVEIIFIFIPLLLHGGLGIKIWLEGKSNIRSYPYMGNVRYTLQRVTGIIAFVFIFIHIWHMHWVGEYLPGGAMFDPHNASATAAYALQQHMWWAGPLYFVGITAAVFHLANGVWSFFITWGVTIGPKSQRESGWTWAVAGFLLATVGWAALGGFLTYKYAEPPTGEYQMPSPEHPQMPGGDL